MGSLRFAGLQTRPTEVLDLTSLTVDEFRQLAPPFEAAFQGPMARWHLDGRPRTARRYTHGQDLLPLHGKGSNRVMIWWLIVILGEMEQSQGISR